VTIGRGQRKQPNRQSGGARGTMGRLRNGPGRPDGQQIAGIQTLRRGSRTELAVGESTSFSGAADEDARQAVAVRSPIASPLP